jgi:chromate reductase, NAD(P)H dehydrogenase (quinone)
MIHVLAISGSLRQASSNSTLLRIAATVAPAGCEVAIYDGIGDLPHFNPDLDGAEPPAVLDFRARLQGVDGVLISSPEYAHGVPGVIKNALDWIVGSGEFMEKPVALLNASALSRFAHPQLAETLTVMGAYLVPEASPTIPLAGNRVHEETFTVDQPENAAALREAVAALVRAIEARP